jgi:hypothetical protein
MYAYLWYERAHHAIKMGVAEVPAERMLAYAAEFELRPDPRSLLTIAIPRGEAIRVFHHLMEIYIEGLGLKLVDGFAELYHLGERYNFTDLSKLFTITVEDIVRFVSEQDRRRQRRLRDKAKERVEEWHDINNGSGR